MNEPAVADELRLEMDDWTHQVSGKWIIFARLTADEWAEDPQEWGTLGRFYSFNRRHANFHRPKAATPDGARVEIRREFGEHVVFLAAFQHGRINWHLPDERPPGTEGDYRWDGCSFAGFWVPPESAVEHADALQPEAGGEYLRSTCRDVLKTWNAYCNGDVYAVQVEVYRLLRLESGDPVLAYECYKSAEPEGVDSLGGLFGAEGVEEAKSEVLASAFSQAGL